MNVQKALEASERVREDNEALRKLDVEYRERRDVLLERLYEDLNVMVAESADEVVNG